MSWYEGVEGTSKDLNPLSRQEQGGRSKKWKEEEEEEVETRIELHPALHTCVCVCVSSPLLSVKVNTVNAV